MTKVFFDCEFTGLHQKTTLISIGLISECGKTFYAELTDYDESQIDEWLEKNVISNLTQRHIASIFTHITEECNAGELPDSLVISANTQAVKEELTRWLKQFGEVEMWSDCLAYDWVLFNNIFGTAFDIPKNVYYIPFDLSTVFKVHGIDPDISREEFSRMVTSLDAEPACSKHNALWDAKVIKRCYELLTKYRLI